MGTGAAVVVILAAVSIPQIQEHQENELREDVEQLYTSIDTLAREEEVRADARNHYYAAIEYMEGGAWDRAREEQETL